MLLIKRIEPWGTPEEAWHLVDREPELKTYSYCSGQWGGYKASRDCGFREEKVEDLGDEKVLRRNWCSTESKAFLRSIEREYRSTCSHIRKGTKIQWWIGVRFLQRSQGETNRDDFSHLGVFSHLGNREIQGWTVVSPYVGMPPMDDFSSNYTARTSARRHVLKHLPVVFERCPAWPTTAFFYFFSSSGVNHAQTSSKKGSGQSMMW